jgi:hypothetical protein
MSIGGEFEAEVDLGPLVLETLVGLKASFDSVTKELRKSREEEAAYQRGAVSVPLRQSAMSNSAGASLIMDMGGPSYGRLWEVRRITVGGALWTSTVAGQGLLIVTASSGQVTPALYDIADQSPTLPDVALYSSRQLVVRHPNHLFLVILTPTATTQYAAGGEATDLPDRRVPLRTID